MSSWGHRTFDDDIALDWLEDLHESEPIAFFRHCLDLTDQQDLCFLACVGVVCTAEVIHAIIATPRLGMPVSAKEWCCNQESIQQSATELVPQAITALDRVLQDSSEMWVRWSDLGETHFGTWHSEVDALRTLLCLTRTTP